MTREDIVKIILRDDSPVQGDDIYEETEILDEDDFEESKCEEEVNSIYDTACESKRRRELEHLNVEFPEFDIDSVGKNESIASARSRAWWESMWDM